MRYRTYTLRIERRADVPDLSVEELDEMHDSIQDAEDVVNDHLPEGFYCKIEHHAERGEGVDLAAVHRLEQMSEQA